MNKAVLFSSDKALINPTADKMSNYLMTTVGHLADEDLDSQEK